MLTPPPSPPPCAAQVRHEMFGTGVDENAGEAAVGLPSAEACEQMELRTSKLIGTTLMQNSRVSHIESHTCPLAEDGSRRGHAIVVDLLQHPGSEEAAATFERAGLAVTRVFGRTNSQ